MKPRTPHRPRAPLTIAAALAGAALGAHSFGANLTLTPIALTGTDGPLGPGLGPGFVFHRSFLLNFGPFWPTINDRGQVLFSARVDYPGAVPFSRPDGVWLRRDEALQPVAVEGRDEEFGPGMGPGATFAAVGQYPIFNDAPQIAFAATLSAQGDPLDGKAILYRWDNGDLTPLAATKVIGALGPNLPDESDAARTFRTSPALWSIDGRRVMDDAGRVVFCSYTAGEPSVGEYGVWITTDDGPRPLAFPERTSLGPLGFPDSYFWRFSALYWTTLTGDGRAIFGASPVRAGAGIFASDGSTQPAPLIMPAVHDAPDPGIGKGVEWDGFIYEIFGANSAGQVAFSARLEWPPPLDFARDGVFLRDLDGAIRTIALDETDGPLGPGLGPGSRFDFLRFTLDYSYPFLGALAINSAGQVLFLALVRSQGAGPDGFGMWLGDETGNVPVALPGVQGPQGPGLEPGSEFGDLRARPCLNARGEVLFQVFDLRDSNADEGVWAYTRGALHPLVVDGDLITFDDGSGPRTKIVSEARICTAGRAVDVYDLYDEKPLPTGGDDGRPTSLSNDGDVVLTIRFTDGSGGVFLTHLDHIAADMNRDRAVDTADLGALLRVYGTDDPHADLMMDGKVDAADLAVMLEAFNR